MISTCCYNKKQKTCVTYNIPTVNNVVIATALSDRCRVCGGKLEYVSIINGPDGVYQIFKCKSCGVATIN